ncbi:L-seryl-tRNA(Sec)_kinase [Hexamita inflata]|uniref:L-seryl-tRNA(Sec)_kinase n=1 Tax=Hexamita inflata TaxID=28002 RepID=A0ABP1L0C1_9EUKA
MIVVLVGPPACGKSTLMAKLKLEYEEASFLQVDDLFSSVSQANISKYDFDSIQSQFFEQLSENTSDLIFCENNLPLPSSRRRIVQICEQKNYNHLFVNLNIPLEECVRRNSLRSNPVPDPVLVKLFELQFLTGRSRVQNVFEYDASNYNQLLGQIQTLRTQKQIRAQTNGFNPVSAFKDKLEASSRKILKQFVQTNSAQNALKLNEFRKLFVKEFEGENFEEELVEAFSHIK